MEERGAKGARMCVCACVHACVRAVMKWREGLVLQDKGQGCIAGIRAEG